MSEENKFIEDDLAILAEFVDESEADLNSVDRFFVELESNPDDTELINSIFRPLHSIKGNSAFLGLLQVRRLAHEMESLLDEMRKQQCVVTPELISTLLAGVDEIKAVLGRIRNREPEVADENSFNQLIVSVQQARTSETPPLMRSVDPPPDRPKQAKPESVAIERTIRIPEKYLDELEKIQARLAALPEQLTSSTQDIQKVVADTASVLSEIAVTFSARLTSLRFAPASELLQRVPRIVRETAAATGKTVRVKLMGETVRLPKSVIGALETPLMHMVRNAVDHGIESPEDRRNSGKPVEGQVSVEVREDKESFIVRVVDDGAGIDFKSLLIKAISKGIVSQSDNVTREAVMNLIFVPGVSSASEVTEISGRGVGMDVVKNMVETAGGKIQVQSKSRKGTELIVSIPRS